MTQESAPLHLCKINPIGPQQEFIMAGLCDHFIYLDSNFTKVCFVKGPIDNKSALLQAMAWRRTGDKLFSEPMLNQLIDAYVQPYGKMT